MLQRSRGQLITHFNTQKKSEAAKMTDLNAATEHEALTSSTLISAVTVVPRGAALTLLIIKFTEE